MPENPWPHDMTLTVDDRPNSLLELLWLREAHELRPEGQALPPLLVDTPSPAEHPVGDVVRGEWERMWADLWAEVVAHAGQEPDPRLFEQLNRMAVGSSDREALLEEIVGPHVVDLFGRSAFEDDSYQDWEQRGMAAHIASRREVLENSPERRDLDALIPAWRAGLVKVVTIPCRGEHTRRVGPHALLVTDETRGDSARYRRALESFA